MRRMLALTALFLSPLNCVWGQARPSSSDLHKLPADIPMCNGVAPKGWQWGAVVTVYISESFTAFPIAR